MEAYAEAKALLFAQSDVGIVNADDEWAHVMLERAKCPMHTYSAKRNDADLVGKDIRLSASGVRFVAMHGDAIARMPRHPRHVLGLQCAERHCLRLRARHIARRLLGRARHGKARQRAAPRCFETDRD